jgi:hypothetical protein
LNVLTFYAECSLPSFSLVKQAGFDWRQAIKWLSRSAAERGYTTRVVTDTATPIEAWLRVGNARESGLMRWILQAQAEAIAKSEGPAVMVSPDSLVKGSLDCLFGAWDVVLLTRQKPKPIVNSVIAFRPSPDLHKLWLAMCRHAESLGPESLEWGADIDALVSYLDIQPLEDGVRVVDGVRVRLMPMASVFTSVDRAFIRPPTTPIWDFKGSRKKLMRQYAVLP